MTTPNITQSQWPEIYIALLTGNEADRALAEKIRPTQGDRDTISDKAVESLTPEDWGRIRLAVKRRIADIAEFSPPGLYVILKALWPARAASEAIRFAEANRTSSVSGTPVLWLPFGQRSIRDGEVITNVGRYFRVTLTEVAGMCVTHTDVRCEFDGSGSVTCWKCLAEEKAGSAADRAALRGKVCGESAERVGNQVKYTGRFIIQYFDTNTEEIVATLPEAHAKARLHVHNSAAAQPFPRERTYLYGPGDGTTSVMIREEISPSLPEAE